MREDYSSESTPEYSSEFNRNSGFFQLDAFIPVMVLSIGLILLLGWQVSNSSAQRSLLEDAITRQQPAVNQSNQVQASLAKLAGDLLQAAQTDDTAKAIAAKFGIQQNGGAPGAAVAGGS